MINICGRGVMAAAADLKSAGVIRTGSSPVARTICLGSTMVSASPCQGEYTGSIPVQDSISVGTRIGIAHCLRNSGLWVRIPPYRLSPPMAQLVAHFTLNEDVLGSSPSGRT